MKKSSTQIIRERTDRINNFIFENSTKVYFGKGCVKEYLYKYGLPKFKRFATEVWGVSADGKTDEETALAGVEALADFIKEIGLPMTLRELGVTEQTDLREIADTVAIVPGSYKKMTHEEILAIFKECY